MKITIAKNAGFCFGVKRAYDLTPARNASRSEAGGCVNTYVLGKLVHNKDVCNELQKRGIKEIKSLDDIREGTVIFTAHGVGPGLYEKASAKGLKIIDTTCPKVIRAQRLAKNCAEKRHVVLVFGDKHHKEVKSVFEWSGKKAKIVGGFEEAAKLNLDKNKKYCLISQTTQNTEEFRRIIACLKKNLKNFSYFNTICPSTNDRQKEIRKLAKNNDAVIVIGGKDSANSKMLFSISRKINPHSYFVENAKQLKKKWFDGIKKIAIAAGASTPEWIIGEIKEKIQKI